MIPFNGLSVKTPELKKVKNLFDGLPLKKYKIGLMTSIERSQKLV